MALLLLLLLLLLAHLVVRRVEELLLLRGLHLPKARVALLGHVHARGCLIRHGACPSR